MEGGGTCHAVSVVLAAPNALNSGEGQVPERPWRQKGMGTSVCRMNE